MTRRLASHYASSLSRYVISHYETPREGRAEFICPGLVDRTRRLSAHWKLQKHKHDYFQMIYFLQGAIRFYLQEQVYGKWTGPLCPPAITFVPDRLPPAERIPP